MLVLLLSAVTRAQGQTAVIISALAVGTTPVKETKEILYTRFADFSKTQSVAVGLKLEAGDLLEGGSSQVRLEVTCPKGSLALFSGAFRVVIQPGEKACTFNMLKGNLDFLAVEPTEVGLGGAVAGSRSTQYGIRLSREGGGVRRRILVFEGEVFSSDRKEAIAAGTQLVYEGDAPPRLEKIEIEELQRTADVYSQFDVSKAGVSLPNPEKTAGELSRLHYDVLLSPEDMDKRIQLGMLQRQYKIFAEAKYNFALALRHSGKDDLLAQVQPPRDSKYLCVEAGKAFARGDAKGAAALAKVALDLNKEDHQLTKADYESCRKLAATPK
jgi:hypothetical protein